MPFDQNQLPTWNKEGVEPPQSLKDDGWQPSQKPPADYFNWFFNKTFKALQSLFTNAQHKEEKGQPGGYAALDENGKVINADGTYPGGVQSVNGKTGNVNLTASDVGAVSQEDFAAHTADNVKHITAAERAAWNSAEANAKAYTDSAPEAMQRNLGVFNVYKSGKDENGIFTIVEYERADGTLYARSVLSGGTSPQYTTRTITYYDNDGTTVLRTDPYTLIYDADGDLIGEVKQ
jgi:hypothetical protein